MERNDQPRADVIDLGSASTETKGSFGPYGDVGLTQPTLGLSDD